VAEMTCGGDLYELTGWNAGDGRVFGEICVYRGCTINDGVQNEKQVVVKRCDADTVAELKEAFTLYVESQVKD
jgi:hypothetical protein